MQNNNSWKTKCHATLFSLGWAFPDVAWVSSCLTYIQDIRRYTKIRWEEEVLHRQSTKHIQETIKLIRTNDLMYIGTCELSKHHIWLWYVFFELCVPFDILGFSHFSTLFTKHLSLKKVKLNNLFNM